ncbi:MAG: rhomboid family intramembrane serine protease [Saprospiraceae bacterium]
MNVMVFLAANILNGAIDQYLILFYPTLEEFKPVQLVTSMFMHADLGHLFFNMFGLFIFGPKLESLWGARKFLFYYLFCGFGALILYLIVNTIEIKYFGGEAGALVGASGAIFGVMAAYGLKFPNETLQLIFPPISVRAVYLVLTLMSIDILFGFRMANTGIAHFAHIGGAVFGFFLMEYWDKFGSKL